MQVHHWSTCDKGSGNWLIRSSMWMQDSTSADVDTGDGSAIAVPRQYIDLSSSSACIADMVELHCALHVSESDWLPAATSLRAYERVNLRRGCWALGSVCPLSGTALDALGLGKFCTSKPPAFEMLMRPHTCSDIAPEPDYHKSLSPHHSIVVDFLGTDTFKRSSSTKTTTYGAAFGGLTRAVVTHLCTPPIPRI